MCLHTIAYLFICIILFLTMLAQHPLIGLFTQNIISCMNNAACNELGTILTNYILTASCNLLYAIVKRLDLCVFACEESPLWSNDASKRFNNGLQQSFLGELDFLVNIGTRVYAAINYGFRSNNARKVLKLIPAIPVGILDSKDFCFSVYSGMSNGLSSLL